jgi:hypothetical protein
MACSFGLQTPHAWPGRLQVPNTPQLPQFYWAIANIEFKGSIQ